MIYLYAQSGCDFSQHFIFSNFLLYCKSLCLLKWKALMNAHVLVNKYEILSCSRITRTLDEQYKKELIYKIKKINKSVRKYLNCHCLRSPQQNPACYHC
jgi:hypothetical protein